MTKHNQRQFAGLDDAQAIIDYGMMLVAVLASPDIEVPDGIRLTVWHMIGHAEAIKARSET